MKKTFIFDLDGTLALIHKRRALANLPNGKIDWDIFLDPKNISLDEPNKPVILMANILHRLDYEIIIFSGRSGATKPETVEWLTENEVPYDVLKMRPIIRKPVDWLMMPDDQLKKYWLGEMFPGKMQENIIAIFDDRDQVVNMWRSNKLTAFQVAEGDF